MSKNYKINWQKEKIDIAKSAMSSFISRPNHGFTYEQIAIMSKRYAEEMIKQLNGNYEKDIINNTKQGMIEKFKDK